MTTKELTHEIEERGWHCQTDDSWHDRSAYRAFFRGFSTPWRESLEEVLTDVKAYQEPEKPNL